MRWTFLLKGGLICLAVAAILVPLQFYYGVVVSRGGGYSAPLLSTDLSSVRVIILGDSHVRDAFAGVDLPKGVLQLAFGGDSVKEMYLKTKYVVQRAPRLSCILLQADYHVLSTYRMTANNRFETFSFSTAADLNRVYSGVTLTRAKQALFTRIPIAYGPNRSEAVQVFLEHIDTLARQIAIARRVERKTADWSDRPPLERAEEASARIGRQFYGAPVEAELVSVVAEIVRLAREEGVDVYGLRYPLTDEYLSALEERVDLGAVENAIQQAGVATIQDYSELYRSEPAYFHNQDHLNQNGSRRFAATIFSRLEAMGCL